MLILIISLIHVNLYQSLIEYRLKTHLKGNAVLFTSNGQIFARYKWSASLLVCLIIWSTTEEYVDRKNTFVIFLNTWEDMHMLSVCLLVFMYALYVGIYSKALKVFWRQQGFNEVEMRTILLISQGYFIYDYATCNEQN